MMLRPLSATLAVLFSALPISSAFPQAEHAQRVAVEVATRRAQVRALLCEQDKLGPTALQAQNPAALLPSSPPTGTGGPVALPADCPRR